MPTDVLPLRLLLQPSGLVIEIKQTDSLVGRHSTADVRLPLPDVSRRHCQIVYDDNGWNVIDLDSLNGVWVNDQRVNQSTLGQNDTLTIGPYRFLVSLAEDVKDDDQTGVLQSIIRILPQPQAATYRKAS